LANNGGPTQTIALQATSPLVNAGSNPAALTTDQRGTGFVRVSGTAADIGAFEVQAAAAPVTVSSAVVNAGGSAEFQNQRSSVTSLTVTFSGLVTFSGATAAAFKLSRVAGGTAGDVTLAAQDLSTATQSIIKLTFSGALTEGAANS